MKENIFQNILAKEILARFEESQMIAIVHRSSMLAEVNREVKVVFKRVGMTMLDRYGRATIEKALTNTKYISIMPLFKVSEAIIVSPEAKVDVLLKTLKKTPQLTLMGK
ncbi:39S ribosomal protein L10, mitochondrial [Diaphorina citri]|uniref:39S ribosomal protein L10, mitochondrial n=1 Tax=Diaphorina citri TaxID=121845 RepID=A0A3Q0II47_DIACI|nr:39S ribosomal protein L10, mitochondrial [Diaphorina citri]